MPDSSRTAVLLLAHGTPDTLDEIPQYLSNVTGGRPLPDAAVEEIRHRYGLIGHSPLTEITLAQGRLLGEQIGVPVYVAMRNWKPYIADVVGQMRSDGVTSAVAICLAPQNSRTSVGLYRRAVFTAAEEAMAIDFIEGWADHPLLADAFAERLSPLWQQMSKDYGEPVPVLFTAHSVPCRTVQTGSASPPSSERSARGSSTSAIGPDPYPVEAKGTASLVASRVDGLPADRWFFAFQSQGMSGGPWIGPTVEDTLTAIRQQGYRAVILQPIGFLCDHVEILYDVDIAFHDFAVKIDLKLKRPESLNTSPTLTAALADLVQQGMQRLAARQVS